MMSILSKFAATCALVVCCHASSQTSPDIVLGPPPHPEESVEESYDPQFVVGARRSDFPYFNGTRRVWFTRYQVHRALEAISSENPVRLRNSAGEPISAQISMADFCQAALQGTVSILVTNMGNDASPEYQTFNATRLARQPYGDCAPYFRRNSHLVPNLNRQGFFRVSEQYGKGIRDSRLIPYRSIAVDPAFLPNGTVIYIPELVGFQTPFGAHDGLLIANDRGGGIRGNHIDLFIGYPGNPVPSFVTSRAADQIEVMIVSDDRVRTRLRQLVLWRQ